LRRSALVLLLVLAGCGRAARAPEADRNSAGAQLERAAIAAGVVADPARLDPVGAYAAEDDRACLVRSGDGYRIGANVDFGDGHGCLARGVAKGMDRLAVALDDGCRFEAHFDGRRLTFPPVLPEGCNRHCSGRASLTALSAERLSGAESEAAALRGTDGKPLCG